MAMPLFSSSPVWCVPLCFTWEHLQAMCASLLACDKVLSITYFYLIRAGLTFMHTLPATWTLLKIKFAVLCFKYNCGASSDEFQEASLHVSISSILNDRLIQFTEDNGLRASSQAEYRPKLSTLHCLFTLQHFIAKSIHFKKPLNYFS